MKKVLFFGPLLAPLLFLPFTAFAAADISSISPDPVALTSLDDHTDIELQGQMDNTIVADPYRQETLFIFKPDGSFFTTENNGANTGPDTPFDFTLDSFGFSHYNPSSIPGSWPVVIVEYSATMPTTCFTSYTLCTSSETIAATGDITFTYTPPPPTPTDSWMPDPVALLADITAGVQSTGTSIWPLFALMGIIIAFIIAGWVVSFIRKSVGNQPGSPGYDSTRGSGASARNRARREEDGPGGGKSLI